MFENVITIYDKIRCHLLQKFIFPGIFTSSLIFWLLIWNWFYINNILSHCKQRIWTCYNYIMFHFRLDYWAYCCIFENGVLAHVYARGCKHCCKLHYCL